MEVSEHLWLFSTLTLEIMVLIGLCSGVVESPMTFSLQCASKAQQERTLISVWLTWLRCLVLVRRIAHALLPTHIDIQISRPNVMPKDSFTLTYKGRSNRSSNCSTK